MLVLSVTAIVMFHIGNRLFAWILVGPLLSTAALSYTYFTMGSNLGWTAVTAEFTNHIDIGDNVRQVFYARFIGWFLSFPGLLYLFEMNAEIHSGDDASVEIFNNNLLQLGTTEVWVVGLLIGSLVETSYKWGYFVFALTSQFFAVGLLLWRQLFGHIRALTILNIVVMGIYTVVFLILYPIAWAVSLGGNVIQPDSEMVYFGILDLLMFIVLPTIVFFDSFCGAIFVKKTAEPSDDVEKQVETIPSPSDPSEDTEVPASQI